MRDDDELSPLRELPEQLDEAADVRVVEGGLDLIQEVEGTRTGKEEREEERDRAEGFLASREEGEARDALAGRLELDLDARLFAVLAAVAADEPPLPPGKRVPATSAKWCSTAA